ncbi:MAG TPA: ATP-binding protein [Candidatus Acidoferrales bacterium]|nr:ATP-binding protein [Candidatus Acidoferrales bacterium]
MNTATPFPWTGPTAAENVRTGFRSISNTLHSAHEEGLLQAQRGEAVGRLAGGMVHEFNLLSGVMRYCDLLLTRLDSCDRRSRYVDEIRLATMQATALVQQLLLFARPQVSQVRALCLNQIVQALQDLLTRLIGENIVLELSLDPDLGPVAIDQAQAQQIFLNLVLNAGDALPNGGNVVKTANCQFQNIPGSERVGRGAPTFPCVLPTVSDNGCGMDTKTRRPLFEPFCTTKGAGKGTGLGLTTVRSIVTTNGGLIQVETVADRGMPVMILLVRALHSPAPECPDVVIPYSDTSRTTFQELKKESHL